MILGMDIIAAYIMDRQYVLLTIIQVRIQILLEQLFFMLKTKNIISDLPFSIHYIGRKSFLQNMG